MKMRFIKQLLAFTVILMIWGCAQQISPTGGKRDEIPPKLVKSIPENKQLNYKETTVELLFDEYVVTENIQQKLFVTPDAGEYDVKTLPMGVRLKFKKPLDSATTYSLSFGDAVKDFSEKNPAKNLRLVFSTGNSIDSASVSGDVKDMLTNEPAIDALVGLYPNSDTLNIEKMKPTYFSRTDSSGRFNLENVHPATYKLIAITDGNRSMTYQPKAEKMAYLSDSLVLSPSTQISSASLKLFFANFSPQKVKTTLQRPNTYKILYDKGIEFYKVKFEQKTDSIPYYQSANNELTFYNPKNRKDTIRVNIWVKDSVGLTFEHLQKIKFREPRTTGRNADTKEPFNMTVWPTDAEQITPKIGTTRLTFSKPIANANLKQIQLFSDSTKTEKVDSSAFIWQNQKTILEIKHPFDAQKELKLIVPKNTFFSIENDTIAPQIIKIPVKEAEEYSVVQGEIRGVKSNFIIELLNDKFEVVEKLLNQKKYAFKFIKPNTYFLRIVVDTNNDGKWTTGNFTKKIQPENVKFYPDAIKVKKNFEVIGIDVDIDEK